MTHYRETTSQGSARLCWVGLRWTGRRNTCRLSSCRRCHCVPLSELHSVPGGAVCGHASPEPLTSHPATPLLLSRRCTHVTVECVFAQVPRSPASASRTRCAASPPAHAAYPPVPWCASGSLGSDPLPPLVSWAWCTCTCALPSLYPFCPASPSPACRCRQSVYSSHATMSSAPWQEFALPLTSREDKHQNQKDKNITGTLYILLTREAHITTMLE